MWEVSTGLDQLNQSMFISPVRLRGGGALDQVVAVDGGGHHGLGQAGGDELQHGHLGGGVLHGHAVCVWQEI